MNEAGSPGQGSHTNNDQTSQLDLSSVWMDLSYCSITVVKVRVGLWRLTFVVDANPATGVLRDIEDVSRWIGSRRAA